MPESKLENLLLVLLAIFLTNIFSALFQINLLITILFNLICVSIFLVIYFFGYFLRKKLVIKLRNPLKRIISELELYDKIKDDLKLEKKVLNRLYKDCKSSELLEGPFIILSMDSKYKSFFKFQKEGGSPLITIYFWKSSGDKPYQFQIYTPRSPSPYNSKKMNNPSRKAETIQKQKSELNKCIGILREFLELF